MPVKYFVAIVQMRGLSLANKRNYTLETAVSLTSCQLLSHLSRTPKKSHSLIKSLLLWFTVK